MGIRSLFAMFFGVALVLLAFGPSARADEWNQMTKLTFNQPVQIPGHEVLPAGTYWFILANSPSDRDIVRVYSSNWQHEYATLLTQPTIRPQATDHTEIELAERPHNLPQALLKWYYPGRVTGHEFLYSPRHERAFSRDIHENVLVRPFATRS
jgi:hypothetical protein